jgi:hypothetical protein
MQGIESLDNFKKFVSSLGGLGRYEDTYIVHAAEGETVVPMEVLDKNPALKKRLFQSMIDMGIEPGRYIVGNELNSRNPVTGQPEFFLKRIVSQIRKALPGDSEKYLGTIVGLATGNPYLGAIAGGIGSGMEGALGGGLAGFQSPGIKGFTGKEGGIRGFLGGDTLFGKSKTDPLEFAKLFQTGGGDEFKRFLTGDDETSGLIASGGKFFGGGTSKDVKKLDIDDFAKSFGFDNAAAVPEGMKSEFSKAFFGQASKEAKKAGMSVFDYLKLIGLGGVFLDQFSDDSPVGPQAKTYTPTGERLNLVAQGDVQSGPVQFVAQGGVMDLRQGGESEGPGTGTSDDIPAMLSDGEFVMTAKAVRGAGGGDRREGAKRMYQMMDQLEARA